MSTEQNTNIAVNGGSALNVQLCRVAWKSKLTGATGHGSPTHYSIVDAAVKSANLRLWKEIEHWVEWV